MCACSLCVLRMICLNKKKIEKKNLIGLKRERTKGFSANYNANQIIIYNYILCNRLSDILCIMCFNTIFSCNFPSYVKQTTTKKITNTNALVKLTSSIEVRKQKLERRNEICEEEIN